MAYPEIGTIGHGLYEVDESGKTLASNTPDRCYETRLKDTLEAQEFISLRSFLGTSRLTVRRNCVARNWRILLALPRNSSRRERFWDGFKGEWNLDRARSGADRPSPIRTTRK